MENQRLGPVLPGEAKDQLCAARHLQNVSVRRATVPAWIILVISVFCGVQAVTPAYRGPGSVVTVIAVVLLVVALLRMSARNGWRAMRSWPKPKWNGAEVALIAAAALVGGAVGPHLLANNGDTAVTSWGLGAAVAVTVAASLSGAYASYRRRVSHIWQL
jgi:Mn2+/Fe2+ NRAMP family transporter